MHPERDSPLGQQAVIEYLKGENRVLREKLGKKRVLLNDDQRRRLAEKGKALGRKLLGEMGCIVTPDTNHQGLDNRLITLPVLV